MRLGKEQAAGFVEDREADDLEQAPAAERPLPVTAESERAVAQQAPATVTR